MIRLGERLEFRRRSERERSGKALIGDPKTDGFHELVVFGRFGCDLFFDLRSRFAFDEFLSGLDLGLLHQINVLVEIKRSRCIRYVFGQSTKDENVFHVLAHVLNVVLLVDRNLFQLAGENGGHLVVLDVLAERRHFVSQIRLVRAPRFVGCSPSRLLLNSKGDQLGREPGHECVACFRRRIERCPNTRDFLRVSQRLSHRVLNRRSFGSGCWLKVIFGRVRWFIEGRLGLIGSFLSETLLLTDIFFRRSQSLCVDVLLLLGRVRRPRPASRFERKVTWHPKINQFLVERSQERISAGIRQRVSFSLFRKRGEFRNDFLCRNLFFGFGVGFFFTGSAVPSGDETFGEFNVWIRLRFSHIGSWPRFDLCL